MLQISSSNFFCWPWRYTVTFFIFFPKLDRGHHPFFKLKGDLKATTLSENSVWYSIISRRLWVLMWRKSTCAKADFQSLGLHPWSALSSLSMNGTKQCRIASVVSLEALRKCRQIPSVLSSFYLIRISDTLPCCLQTLWMQTVASARSTDVFVVL